jgi:hypothetical protein
MIRKVQHYVAVMWQIAAEVIVPINRAGGNGTGFRGQLLFFPDELDVQCLSATIAEQSPCSKSDRRVTPAD